MQDRKADNPDSSISMSDFIMDDYSPSSDRIHLKINEPTKTAKGTLPLKAKPFSMFAASKSYETHNAFHKVEKLKKTTGSEDFYFFKHNTSATAINELEAVIAQFYQLLIPGYTPGVHVHYDDNNPGKPYLGLASKAIPEFKTLFDDPLTEKDLKNDNIITGLAHCLTASYLLEEDDLHRGNMSKLGQRVDFDMSLWPILANYKNIGVIDWTFRYPDADGFKITARDIANFPYLQDAKPFYWPTIPHRIIPDSIYQSLSKAVALSQNGFSKQDNELYSRLKDIDLFNFYKFKVLIKFCLLNENILQAISSKHIRKANHHLLIKIRTLFKKRIIETKNILLGMDEFRTFMRHHSREVKELINIELLSWNQKISRKLKKHPEYKDCLINTDEINDLFNEMAVQSNKQSTHLTSQ